MGGCERRIEKRVVKGGKPVRRYEYSSSTLLIRDGISLLWGMAPLLFVSIRIICMMYSTDLYAVMGEDDALAG